MLAIKTKPWYTSKIFLGNVVIMGIDVAQYFSVPEHTPVGTVASIATAITAVLVIVARIWFTNQPISGKAQQEVSAKVTTIE